MRYATIKAWAEHFGRSENIKVSSKQIRNRLNRAKMVSEDGRDRIGRCLEASFYSEADVRQVCADLLIPEIPKVDENGFFEKEDKKYGTVKAWSKVLPISDTGIKYRLEKGKAQAIIGRDRQGVIRNLYAEHDVFRVCDGLLETNTPRADKRGFILIDQVLYGTVTTWSRELGLYWQAIDKCLKKANAIGIIAHDSARASQNFFTESQIRSACDDLLNKNIPRANEEGFVFIEGERYAHLLGWSNEFGISRRVIKEKLDKNNKTGITGRNAKGKFVENGFYSETDVRHTCGSLIGDYPKAGKDGLISIDGVRFGTVDRWRSITGISQNGLCIRLKRLGKKGITGKNKQGKVMMYAFYAEYDVQEACSDLLDTTTPRANAAGFFELKGSRYGTTESWRRELKIRSFTTVKLRINRSGAQGIDGIIKSGNFIEGGFYSETDVRSACADLLSKRNPHAA